MTEQIELDLTTAEGLISFGKILVACKIKSFRIVGEEMVLTTVGRIPDLEIYIPLPREESA